MTQISSLLLVSSKIKGLQLLKSAVLPSVKVSIIKFDTTSIEDILSSLYSDDRFEFIGCIFDSSKDSLWLNSHDKLEVSERNIPAFGDHPLANFLRRLTEQCLRLNQSMPSSQFKSPRLAILSCHLSSSHRTLLAKELARLINIPVEVSKHVSGDNIEVVYVDPRTNAPLKLPLSSLLVREHHERVFGTETTAAAPAASEAPVASARGSSADAKSKRDEKRISEGTTSGAPPGKHTAKRPAHQRHSGLSGFERIRTVGKGGFGTAVLYRKKDDDSLVVLKEINMHELSGPERLLALNEVKVLSMLHHPNIVTYYDSFEEDGILMIEMEYADGGTLETYLKACKTPLSEKEILHFFQQIVSAITYIHERKILHRDLKTANIFLTCDGVSNRLVKVGDFGISKKLSTSRGAAVTVLGTPYYISPEMCEGKAYDEKSDVWALGCVCYECACLQRTFDGTNLPALVNKITKGQFAPIRGNYTEEFKALVMSMLSASPTQRPSAADLLRRLIPELLARDRDAHALADGARLSSSAPAPGSAGASGAGLQNSTRKPTRSVLFYYDPGIGSLTPVELPARLRVLDVAVGSTHAVVVTSEHQVYAFGENKFGQLGLDSYESKTRPVEVEMLRGKGIETACCGNGFSIFRTHNGLLMSCGYGQDGCLGHGEWNTITRPKLVETLLSVDIMCVACGPRHVLALSAGDGLTQTPGAVYAWGCGLHGRTGLGDEEARCKPTQVMFAQGEAVRVHELACGVDGSMLLTELGVYACGSNRHNKLGLNPRLGFLMAMKNIFTTAEVERSLLPTCVKALARYKVRALAMGAHHTAALVDPHQLLTFGRNLEGQLGNGTTRPQHSLVEVKCLQDKHILVRSYAYYTLASVSNLLYFWGLRYIRSREQVTLKRSSVTSSGAGSSRTSPAGSRPHSRRASPPGEQQQPPTATASASTTARSSSFTRSTRAAALGKPPSGSLRNAPTQPSSSVAARERDAGHRKFSSLSKIASKLRNGFRGGASPSQPSSPSAARRSSSPHSTLTSSSGGRALAFSGGFRPLSAAYQHPSVEGLDGSHAYAAGSPADTRSLVSSPDPDAAHVERTSVADGSLAALDSGSDSDSDEESVSLDSEFYLQPVHFLRLDSGGSQNATSSSASSISKAPSSSSSTESMVLTSFWTHGDDLFVLVETSAPPPSKNKKPLGARSSSSVQLQTDSAAPAAEGSASAIASGRYVRAISDSGARSSADMGTQAQLDEAEAEMEARLSFSLNASHQSAASHASSSADELSTSKSSVPTWLQRDWEGDQFVLPLPQQMLSPAIAVPASDHRGQSSRTPRHHHHQQQLIVSTISPADLSPVDTTASATSPQFLPHPPATQPLARGGSHRALKSTSPPNVAPPHASQVNQRPPPPPPPNAHSSRGELLVDSARSSETPSLHTASSTAAQTKLRCEALAPVAVASKPPLPTSSAAASPHSLLSVTACASRVGSLSPNSHSRSPAPVALVPGTSLQLQAASVSTPSSGPAPAPSPSAGAAPSHASARAIVQVKAQAAASSVDLMREISILKEQIDQKDRALHDQQLVVSHLQAELEKEKLESPRAAAAATSTSATGDAPASRQNSNEKNASKSKSSICSIQ